MMPFHRNYVSDNLTFSKMSKYCVQILLFRGSFMFEYFCIPQYVLGSALLSFTSESPDC